MFVIKLWMDAIIVQAIPPVHGGKKVAWHLMFLDTLERLILPVIMENFWTTERANVVNAIHPVLRALDQDPQIVYLPNRMIQISILRAKLGQLPLSAL